jgi:hypothetical protein
MKHVIFVAGLCLTLAQPVLAQEPKKETVTVCIDVQGKDGKPVLDPKTGKPKQDCKVMKKHKKHEGTAIPEKK